MIAPQRCVSVNAEEWRARLDAANAQHLRRLAVLINREFDKLAREVDPKNLTANRLLLKQHEQRLLLILGVEKRATAATFGFFALEMLNGADVEKSEAEIEAPSRADRIVEVMRELARTVSPSGGALAATVKVLAADRDVVRRVENAILAAPNDAPGVIAARLLERPEIVATVSEARATATRTMQAIDRLILQPPPRPLPPSAIVRRSHVSGPRPPQPPRARRFSELVEQLVRHEAPLRARMIAQTNANVIAEVLAQGARGGWGEAKVARELLRVLGGDMARHRALTIARTEIGSASNQATMALARDRVAAGADVEKVWLTIQDGRERQTHHDANGQARDLDEPFDVGGAELMQPGDPSAPLKEIINCRCALLIRERSR